MLHAEMSKITIINDNGTILHHLVFSHSVQQSVFFVVLFPKGVHIHTDLKNGMHLLLLSEQITTKRLPENKNFNIAIT